MNTILFDLSEVFISGLKGVDTPLSDQLGVSELDIKAAFGNSSFVDLMRGNITERKFITEALEKLGSPVPVEVVMGIIRQNFHHAVPGMAELLPKLKTNYRLALLSDHGLEWVEYIQQNFSFMQYFDAQFYSFQLKRMKREPGTFEMLLSNLGISAQECLFVDDLPINIEAAASAGISGIVFESAAQLKKEFLDWNILF